MKRIARLIPARRVFLLACMAELVIAIGLVVCALTVPFSALSLATVLFSLAVKVGGIHQIYVLWREKKADQHSWQKLGTDAISYGLWAVWGLRKHDWVVYVAQGTGVVIILVTLSMVLYYRLQRQPWRDGHYFGSPCGECSRIAKAKYKNANLLMPPPPGVIGKWPMRCYKCDGYIHPVGLVESSDPERSLYIETSCDGSCNRKRLFNVPLGPTEIPPDWCYWVRDGLAGDNEQWIEVSLEEYLRVTRLWIKLHETSDKLMWYAQDRPCRSLFITHEYGGIITRGRPPGEEVDFDALYDCWVGPLEPI